MRKKWKTHLAGCMAAVMGVVSVGCLLPPQNAKASESSEDAAELEGNAKVIYDDDRSSYVLNLPGGSFDAGWLKLPENLYDEVTDGFTIALKVKPDMDCADYARVFQSTSIEYGTGDTWWWDAPDIAFNAGATDGGWNSMLYLGTVVNTTDNGVSGGSTRMKMTWDKVMTKGEWNEVVISISAAEYAVYLNGEKLTLTSTQGDGDLSKVLSNTLDGDFLSSYIYNAIGHSVYASDADFKGSVDDVAFYSYALTERQAAELPSDAAFLYTFEKGTVEGTVVANAAQEKTEEPEEPGLVTADYFWDFEQVSEGSIASSGTADQGTATLQGTAAVTEGEIAINGTSYSSGGNHVLVLSGGSKGTSYVDLPSDIYEGVNANTGFTYSFWAKTDAGVGSYTRIISSATVSNGDEFAYAPYAADSVWNVIFDGSNVYRAIYTSEPDKEVWNLITFTVDKTGIVFYVNGEEAASGTTAGGDTELKARLNTMADLVLNSLGKTNSVWGDADCMVTLDDVSLYKTALTAEEVAEIANSYGFSVTVSERTEYGSAEELTDGTSVTPVEGLAVTSPDGTLATQIMTDRETGRFFYTTSKAGTTAIQASQLGIRASVDFTSGMAYVEGSLVTESGSEDYTLTSGSSREVSDSYNQISFDLAKDGDLVTVTIRSFNGGIAYRYTLHGDAGAAENISGEASEYVLPATATIWRGDSTDVNYEFNFVESSMKTITSLNGNLPVPLLAKDGDIWVLVAEGSVYNEEDPYCASYLSTTSGSRNLKVTFGNKQTGAVTKTYAADGTVSTPWRVAAVADNLNDIVNATVFTSVNPDPDGSLFADTSWIKQGRVAWSWWSEAGDDPVEYDQQFAYIDFAAQNGWEYVCIDFGWCLWDDYRTKITELVEYAEDQGVSIMLWYGVNNTGHSGYTDENGNHAYPYYSLLTTEKIEEQLAWCSEVGVKAVKIDYFESDNQATMKLMYDCATIAAEHKLCVLFHGCNVPSGEQRTFPNVLGYEAVRGAEWFKWNVGSTVATQLTYLFTRNILGGMDYTPSAMLVGQMDTTAAYQLAQIVVYESGIPNYASSIFTLEGFAGLPLMNDIPVTWDETQLIDGYPGEYLAVARRNGEDWYIGAMTAEAWSTTLDLDFLDDGTYYAYIFKDNEDGSDIEIEVTTVTKDSGLSMDLLANGGISVKLTKAEMDLTTAYDGYTFYEAEDDTNTLTGTASVVSWSNTASNQFLSGMKKVTGIGGSTANTLTFQNIEVKETGVYEMRLYFYSGSARRICYSVNGGEMIRTKALSSGLNAVSAETFYVELSAGVNNITFYNDTAKAPDVDRIAISKDVAHEDPTQTDLTDDGTEAEGGTQYEYNVYEATDAVLAGGAILENGIIGWLGGSSSSRASYTVIVEEDGYYYLRITYCTGADRDVQVSINGGDAVTVACPSTGSYTADSADSVYLLVYLEEGENTVALFNASDWAPNIISIGISTESVGTEEPEEPDETEELEDSEEPAGDGIEDPGTNGGDDNSGSEVDDPVSGVSSEDEDSDDAAEAQNSANIVNSPKTGDCRPVFSIVALLAAMTGILLAKKKIR